MMLRVLLVSDTKGRRGSAMLRSVFASLGSSYSGRGYLQPVDGSKYVMAPGFSFLKYTCLHFCSVTISRNVNVECVIYIYITHTENYLLTIIKYY